MVKNINLPDNLLTNLRNGDDDDAHMNILKSMKPTNPLLKNLVPKIVKNYLVRKHTFKNSIHRALISSEEDITEYFTKSIPDDTKSFVENFIECMLYDDIEKPILSRVKGAVMSNTE